MEMRGRSKFPNEEITSSLKMLKTHWDSPEQPNVALRLAQHWARWFPFQPKGLHYLMPCLYHSTNLLQKLHPCYCCSVRSWWWTRSIPEESSLFTFPREWFLLTSGARDWQYSAAGCFGCASQTNAVSQPGSGEGKRQHLCLPWYTVEEGMQDGLYFCQRTANTGHL